MTLRWPGFGVVLVQLAFAEMVNFRFSLSVKVYAGPARTLKVIAS